VNPEPPVLSLSTNGSAVVIQSSSALGNLWYRDGVFRSDLTGSSVALTSESDGHIYTVRSLIDNCLSEESVPLVITGIENSRLLIFPNPVVHYLYLNFPDERVRNITISNMTGQTINEVEISSENSLIDMSGLKSGIYLVTIKDSSEIIVRKIYKK